MKEPIIIKPHAGGLGDVLLFSTLPEYFASKGHPVYWSDRPHGPHPPFRNREVQELILSDPNIEGMSSEEPNAGSVIWKGHDIIRQSKLWGNGLIANEFLHGVPENDLDRNDVPYIAYMPRELPEWKNRIVCTTRSISQPISAASFSAFVSWVMRWHFPEEVIGDIVVLTSKFDGPNGTGSLYRNQTYQVGDLQEKIDILYSCRAFLTIESGDNMLASAVRVSEGQQTFALMTSALFNERIFTMPNIEYYITGQNSPDYKEYR